jgi:glyoxylase-like metal-dependent hydrolase (beta-lactamase superfamily II)
MNSSLVKRREQSATEERSISTNSWLVAPGVWRLKDIFVNVYIIQNREGTEWVLVDAGLKTTAGKIRTLVADLFGKGSVPKAIIMTHGHFDHNGSLIELAEEWGVPVYCHHMERPYLNGKSSYPPPDPSVGGGAMSLASFLYPKGPINADMYLRELTPEENIGEENEEGTIQELPDWKWIHTPGHTPGHISLFREKDGVLIAGDAIVTTMQESILAVALQKKYVSGPPKYFTPDWGAATRSAKALAALEPNVIATGHGPSIYGDEARKELHKLVREFWKWGIPAAGRYVKEPVSFNEDGVPVHIPKSTGTMWKKVAVAAALLAVAYLVQRQRKHAKGFFQKKAIDKVSGLLKTSALGALGAAAPVSPALPAVPLIPAI